MTSSRSAPRDRVQITRASAQVRPRALDLFCGAGGASQGLFNAGFNVVGVDINPQPRYPHEFHRADALTFPLDGFDFIWASPPCQAYTRAQRIQGNEHADLIGAVRERLRDAGVPYAIENVPGAPLIRPVVLCGSMFGLRTYRHRLIEASFPCEQLLCSHVAPNTKMGRPPRDGEFMHVVGNFSDVGAGRNALGIDWMTRDELSEAIPPAYGEFVARAFLATVSPVNHPNSVAESIARRIRELAASPEPMGGEGRTIPASADEPATSTQAHEREP